ncbi:alkene reductase [Paenalcaligenes niemegkensis]|uniref:alkene reductase n=1 Tax=Paenalcaligenes niemegkensis TaxID=2895469 RepID=UPI001EE7AA27|nr:alkene reductase [Paenalcaligenes niemegkensis]MCQ9616365.1 alkene reductase [Paenalcaligenes niemegkensis]
MVNLFDPLRVGDITVTNRIVMAPMTRTRATQGRVPSDLMRNYYCQRASAGLIIAEATSISPQGVGYTHTPGIWSSAQTEGWKNITQAVHSKNGKIFLQLWHVGRVSDPELLNGQMPVAPSAIACEGQVSLLRPVRDYVVPRALSCEGIADIVKDFRDAAQNAIAAGFDGIEIHAANGYLIDQFLNDSSNQRQDSYGGSISNRTRLLLEVVDTCASVWGYGRIGVHLSPRGQAHSMFDSAPASLFTHIAGELDRRQVAFILCREAGATQDITKVIRQAYSGVLIVNENYERASAEKTLASGEADAVAFGRSYISNPDLVERFKEQAELASPDSATFYTDGPRGYTDYPTHASLVS